MTERVFNFAPNSAELDPIDKEILLKLIEDVVQNQDKYNRIEIIGHSDQTGTENSNLEVSKERAIKILEMMKEAGIDRKKIRTSWLASTEPIENAKDSSVNRRVEIKFFKEKKVPLTTTN
jgi:OOP family OmpA-OmpF porin